MRTTKDQHPGAAPTRFDGPLVLTLLLAALCLLPRIRENTLLMWSIAGASVFLLAWLIVLTRLVARRGSSPAIRIVLLKTHYVQAILQSCVFLYWGWYWRPVYDFAALIAAQIVSALVAQGTRVQPRLWTLSNYFQHQSVYLVQG